MGSILGVVLPVFGLILLGFLARRGGWLGPNTMAELNRFVVWLALPAMLFHVMAHTAWSILWQPGFVAAFGLASMGLFAVTLALRLRAARPLPDASIEGLNAAYPNSGYMGFPLCLMALGPQSLPLVTIGMIMTVCVLFALAVVCIEIGLQEERRPARLAAKVGLALAKNPLLVAPAMGALVSGTGLPLPEALDSLLKLLGAAASPCALVALGVFLAQQGMVRGRDLQGTLLLVPLKLLALPALVWLLAAQVFRLGPLATHTAVLLAALPTGTGPFMLAEYYRRDARITSATVLISTLTSVLTVAAYLAWIG
ncbi:AEC family transporter [Roseomonas marmotae]|uniref:AEC family transporter n=1 Tax=Roseomonas marmotae TaxID=2768161 RepID=A0ABS3KA17_9PROT|nr:AEC family transporter [Roseomonas marmotae]MBO1074311.1 AEC family transporter [Roseomonas marmotae]QTI78064.1 AEC family transporter [Roseomonas marmotae]